jgi:iron complex transport system substrate-binding protein
MRIVSLACSNTEIVDALGCSDLLVGVDSHSDYPAGVVDRLPRLGPDLEIDIAAVAALKPDLVLATLTVPGHETVIEGLEAAGIPFIAPSPESLDDVYANIREIARLLGVEARGEEVVRRMQSELGPSRENAEARCVPGLDSGPRPGSASPSTSGSASTREGAREPTPSPSLLVQWWPKPVISPGKESWTTDVIHAAGGRNPIGTEAIKSRPIEDDEVVALAPDAIVISWCGIDPEKYRPDVIYGKKMWKDVPAVRNGRVFCVPEAYLGRPGPRLVEGMLALRDIVRGIEKGRERTQP